MHRRIHFKSYTNRSNITNHRYHTLNGMSV